ncbi:MAG: hypothetical protein M1822_008851 [Bathelium mastoideum]|nr:MAG: hypothetical protein M1822_008851 [Bathelium mastoideum]
MGIDYSNVFCVVESSGATTANAFLLPHNARFLIKSTDSRPQKQARQSRHATPTFDYEPTRTLALTIERETFHDPLIGLTFGSNEDSCDVLLANDNQTGISSTHFRLSWNWNQAQGPDANVLLISNLSGNGTTVDGVFLDRAERRMLNTQGFTTVEAGPALLRFRIADAQRKAFVEKWKSFVAEARLSQPRLDRLNIASRNPTPAIRRRGVPATRQKNFYDIGDYQFVETIHQNKGREVIKVAAESDGTLFAIKIVFKGEQFDKGLREVELLNSLQNPCIVPLITSWEDEKGVSLVTKWAYGGDLEKYTQRAKGRLEEKLTMEAAFQILGALKYLHSLSIVHRDVKPENVLVIQESPLLVQLTDFGVSKRIEEKTK